MQGHGEGGKEEEMQMGAAPGPRARHPLHRPHHVESLWKAKKRTPRSVEVVAGWSLHTAPSQIFFSFLLADISLFFFKKNLKINGSPPVNNDNLLRFLASPISVRFVVLWFVIFFSIFSTNT